MYATVSAAAPTASTWTSRPCSLAAEKNSSSLKKPSVNGSAATVAAAIPLTTASAGSRRPRPPRRESCDSLVVTVTAPAVMNSALFAIA